VWRELALRAGRLPGVKIEQSWTRFFVVSSGGHSGTLEIPGADKSADNNRRRTDHGNPSLKNIEFQHATPRCGGQSSLPIGAQLCPPVGAR
jgi:hypothetical protein